MIAIGHLLAPNPGPMTLDGTNTWLLGAAAGPAVVVDPGPTDPDHLAAIVGACPHGIGEIWLTHHHADHSESAPSLARAHGVAVRAYDPALCTGEPLVDGGRVAVDGEEITVLHTPGHTADSVSFLAGDRLLSGDTILGRGTTVIMDPDGDLGAYLATLDRLMDLPGVRGILPGHGPVVDDPAGWLAGYRRHRHERLDQVRAALDGGATTAAEVVDRVYGGLAPELRPAAEASARAQLAYLRRDGDR